MSSSLTAPFPWPGGKRRWANRIWQRFGDPVVYSEPFAGSLAVLLHRPSPCQREVVCDTSGHICNFWRAMREDPEAVAYWADWPSFHDDLTARHRWLMDWHGKCCQKLVEDADWHDPKAAGWWVWGVSNWIRGGFCANPDVGDDIPQVKDPVGGKGVSRQRLDRKPLVEWFDSIQRRLFGLTVLNRDWSSGVTSAVLAARKSSGPKAVFLDPPYLTSNRKVAMYRSDVDGTTNQVARESYEWAVENGERFRIAYACQEGDFPVPVGWDSDTMSFKGVPLANGTRDMVMFSPACLPKSQIPLFGGDD